MTLNPFRYRVKGVQSCFMGGVGFFQGVPVTRVILAKPTDNLHKPMSSHQVAEKCKLACGRLASRPAWVLLSGHTDNQADNELRNVLRISLEMMVGCELSGLSTVVDSTSGSEPRFIHWDHAAVVPPAIYDPSRLRVEIFHSIVFHIRSEKDLPLLQNWSMALDVQQYDGPRYIKSDNQDLAMGVVAGNAKRWRFTRAVTG